jgi:hypothetical protein
MDYITCSRTKSEYKISVAICENCKRKKTCADYRNYAQPSLFREGSGLPSTTKATGHRGRKKEIAQRELFDMPNPPRQLTLNI